MNDDTTHRYTPADIAAFRLTQHAEKSMSHAPMHTNECGHTFPARLDACPRCKAAKVKPTYEMDGHAVTPDTLTDEEKAYAKEQRRRQAQYPPADGETNYITSTMPKENDK